MNWLRFPSCIVLLSVGCGGADLVANEGFSIACGDGACEWTVVEGDAVYGPSWHDGDPGLELSRPGKIVVEQRAAPVILSARELILEAAVASAEGASVRFELDWYVAGQGGGPTYWDRGPTLVATRSFPVETSGVIGLERLVTTPTPEVSGLVLRIVKEGTGQVVVDEISLREPTPEVR